MLAGLWGAHNYMDMAMAKKVKAKITACYHSYNWRQQKGEIRPAGCSAKPFQVLRPTDPPVQSIPSGRKKFLKMQKNTRFDSKDQMLVNIFHFAQVRDLAAIYDSYNCGIIWKFGHCRPWPTKRQGFRFNKPAN